MSQQPQGYHGRGGQFPQGPRYLLHTFKGRRDSCRSTLAPRPDARPLVTRPAYEACPHRSRSTPCSRSLCRAFLTVHQGEAGAGAGASGHGEDTPVEPACSSATDITTAPAISAAVPNDGAPAAGAAAGAPAATPFTATSPARPAGAPRCHAAPALAALIHTPAAPDGSAPAAPMLPEPLPALPLPLVPANGCGAASAPPVIVPLPAATFVPRANTGKAGGGGPAAAHPAGISKAELRRQRR